MSRLKSLLAPLSLVATILAVATVSLAQDTSVPPGSTKLKTARASGSSSDHRPVIFVHGVGSDDLNLWFMAVEYFKTQGYKPGDITVIQYASLEGAVPASEQLAVEVDWLLAKTGKPKLDIVSHSMGSLVSKRCIVEGGCKGKVAHWENLAGANNGTNLKLDAAFGIDPKKQTVIDVKPDSDLVKRLHELGEKEMRDQGVITQVQWTPGDTSIVPPELSKESFAENVQLSPLVTHQTILFDLSVIQRTCAFLNR